MGLNYDQIAQGYDLHRRGGGPYFEKLVELARGCAGGPFLELGAGTGNNTAALYRAFPCGIVALDASEGMLSRGRGKGVPARWVRGKAERLPFAGGAFSFIYATYVLHHIRDLNALFSECARVLGHGCAAFVTVPESFIAQHPMNRYFPSFAGIDLARFQPVDAVTGALASAGFSGVGVSYSVAEPRVIDAAYIERIAGKFISTYDLIPADEFEEGLSRLRADVAARGPLELTIAREAVLIWGFR